MAKLSEIYGVDDNGFAGEIASETLSQGQGSEDIWGATVDQEARSKGGRPFDPGDVSVTHNKGDSRAKTKGNHGEQP